MRILLITIFKLSYYSLCKNSLLCALSYLSKTFPLAYRMFPQTFLCVCLFLTSVCRSERCRRCWPTMKTSVQGWVMQSKVYSCCKPMIQFVPNTVKYPRVVLFQSREPAGRRTLLYGQAVLFRHVYSDMVKPVLIWPCYCHAGTMMF